jgi:hypothetical protein
VEGRIARPGVEPSVIDALVRGVRRGEVDLRPGERSSWREMELWALEPLLRHAATPEAARWQAGRGYAAHLEALFRAAYGLVRETHAKDVEIEEEEEEYEFVVGPSLTVEPLPTHYARTADALRFARELLEHTFGAALRDTPCPRADTEATRSVGEELVATESLLRGASETARRELGMPRHPAADGDVQRFEAWRAAMDRDPDLRADARMMVPVSYERRSGLVRVWAFLGWRVRYGRVTFATRPSVRLASGAPVAPWQVEWDTQEVPLVTPTLVELQVSKVLDREAFRALCDRWKTRAAIVRALTR